MLMSNSARFPESFFIINNAECPAYRWQTVKSSTVSLCFVIAILVVLLICRPHLHRISTSNVDGKMQAYIDNTYLPRYKRRSIETLLNIIFLKMFEQVNSDR